jgi:O-acetylhomoserine/O-acetylserine sulfhydrylase-like pyridoxal-dependent enzyme
MAQHRRTVIDAGNSIRSNGRYATVAAPLRRVSRLEFHETRHYGYLMKPRRDAARPGRRSAPSTPFSLTAETLPLRMERHVSNAWAWRVSWRAPDGRARALRWPARQPHYERAKRYLPKGQAVFAVDSRGGCAAGQRFIEAPTPDALPTSVTRRVGDPSREHHTPPVSYEELPATASRQQSGSVGLESLTTRRRRRGCAP